MQIKNSIFNQQAKKRHYITRGTRFICETRVCVYYIHLLFAKKRKKTVCMGVMVTYFYP